MITTIKYKLFGITVMTKEETRPKFDERPFVGSACITEEERLDQLAEDLEKLASASDPQRESSQNPS